MNFVRKLYEDAKLRLNRKKLVGLAEKGASGTAVFA
jgi:hypothetical protein